MDIEINLPNKIIKPNKIKNLPDFIVITGENGSGKTQFLTQLYSIDGGANVFIYDNEIRLQRANFVSTNIHYYDLGSEFNTEILTNTWGKLPPRYNSFLNLKKIEGDLISISTTMLFERCKKDHVIDPNSRNPNEISLADLELFKKIYSNKINKLEQTTIEECIINIPIKCENLFTANLTLLYLQYKCKLQLGYNIEESPWAVFNQILKEANFKYRLKEPDISTDNFKIFVQLEDIDNKNLIDLHSLSSGEKTIMSLILALYNSESTQFPEVILFDEPDSSLHPSMSKQMLDVLQNVFVKERKCKVIITTHSPTTVALSPDLSIYRMDRELGFIRKETKENAIKSLTKGLENISIYFENRKQIFVESYIDKYFYENIYTELKRKGFLNNSISLEFITASENKESGDINAGCDFVRTIVNTLSKSGNKTVFGLIDYDNKNNRTNKISILGNNKRYSLENYVLDPIFLAAFILNIEVNEKSKLGFNIDDYIKDFENFTQDKLQNSINKLSEILEADDIQLKQHKTINRMEFEIPSYWYSMKGHDLESKILERIKFLHKHCEKKSLLKKVIDQSVKMFVEYLPYEILETFIELEQK